MKFGYFVLIGLCFYSCVQYVPTKIVNEPIKKPSIEIDLRNQIIKGEVSKQSDFLNNEVKKLSGIVADFNQFVQKVQDDLVAKAGGKDPNYDGDRPILYKDKEVTNQFFLVEGKGKLLKSKIDATRQKILSFIAPSYQLQFSKSIPLTTDENLGRNMSWVDMKFKDMPVAAVLPMLTKWISDASSSERIVLDYWRLKHK